MADNTDIYADALKRLNKLEGKAETAPLDDARKAAILKIMTDTAARRGGEISMNAAGETVTYKIAPNGDVFRKKNGAYEKTPDGNLKDLKHVACGLLMEANLKDLLTDQREKRLKEIEKAQEEMAQDLARLSGKDKDEILELINSPIETDRAAQEKFRADLKSAAGNDRLADQFFYAMWRLRAAEIGIARGTVPADVFGDKNVQIAGEQAGIVASIFRGETVDILGAAKREHVPSEPTDDRFFSAQVYKILQDHEGGDPDRLIVPGELLGEAYKGLPFSRSQVAEIAVKRFEDKATEMGINRADITKAMFEGRIVPHFYDLRMIYEGMGRETDPKILADLSKDLTNSNIGVNADGSPPYPYRGGIDARFRNAEWSSRFGSMADMGPVKTMTTSVVDGKLAYRDVVLTPGELAARAAARGHDIKTVSPFVYFNTMQHPSTDQKLNFNNDYAALRKTRYWPMVEHANTPQGDAGVGVDPMKKFAEGNVHTPPKPVEIAVVQDNKSPESAFRANAEEVAGTAALVAQAALSPRPQVRVSP